MHLHANIYYSRAVGFFNVEIYVSSEIFLESYLIADY